MILKTAIEKLFMIREKAGKARSRAGADEGFDPHEKPFLDHLEDLRTTLIQIAATLSISTVLCFTFHIQIFEFLQLPAKLTIMEDGGTLWDKIDFIVLAPQDILMLMIKVSFFTAIIISTPLLIFFLFQFILPGLRQVEKKMIIPGAAAGFMLFLIGASFSFYYVVPLALKYFFVFQNERIGDINPAAKALSRPIAELQLIGVGGKKIPPKGETQANTQTTPEQTDQLPTAGAALDPGMKSAIRSYMIDLLAVQEGKDIVFRYDESRDKIIIAHSKGAKATYQIGKYFDFITRLTLVFGLSFQLPIVVTVLVKLELLTARVMRSTRTYAWVLILVVSGILTPPDVVTLFLMGGPMIFLYEICVVIASMMERSREKKEKAEEKKRRARMEKLYSSPPDDLSDEEKAELHKNEIKQYEKEHAHLYNNEGHEVDEHGHLIGYDPHATDHTQHDASWHEDHHYWHDGENESEKPVEPEHIESDLPKDQVAAIQDQDSPIPKTEPGAESDHAEPTVKAEPKASPTDNENCEPGGPVVDMNYATLEELMDLPGVDEWLANMIIDHRPYESFNDLEETVGAERVREWMERLMLG